MGGYNATWYCYKCHKKLLENEIYDKLKDDKEPYCPNCKSKLIGEIDNELWTKLT